MTNDARKKQAAKILCIGAANVDRLAKITGPAVLGTSNPGSVEIRAGGVARNVAVSLINYGLNVSLYSRIGDDPDGAFVLQSLSPVECHHIQSSKNARTATYTAVLGPDGELVIGHADMAIYDEITPSELVLIPAAFGDVEVCFADANLPAESLAWLADHKGRARFYVDAVSVTKSTKLTPILDRLDGLFCNSDEAAQILGVSQAFEVDELARQLARLGCPAGIVTMGPDPLAIWQDNNIDVLTLEAVPAKDVTGAGDALIAGTLAKLAGMANFREAARFGIDQARLAVTKMGA